MQWNALECIGMHWNALELIGNEMKRNAMEMKRNAMEMKRNAMECNAMQCNAMQCNALDVFKGRMLNAHDTELTQYQPPAISCHIVRYTVRYEIKEYRGIMNSERYDQIPTFWR